MTINYEVQLSTLKKNKFKSKLMDLMFVVYHIKLITHIARINSFMIKLKPKELRVSNPTQKDIKGLKRNPIYLVLDNVLDTFNIGSLFRLADATGVAKMYLCGNMEYPPSSRIHKAAVGTEKWVPWEKTDSTVELVKRLKSQGIMVISVEQSAKSIHYSLIANHLSFPCAIVVGHETSGVSKDVLDRSDVIVELPMHGINTSFNVWGSAAVILYKIMEYLPQ